MTERIGFIGLGAMGLPMARRLLGAGFAVRGHDVRPEAVETLAAAGGERAATPAEAAEGARLLAVCVFDDVQADAVLFGPEGAIRSLAAGAVVLLHTTVSPEQARALGERLGERGIHLVDAPVTGGVAGAEAGTLTVIASGGARALAEADAALRAMGGRIVVCGETPGAGSAVKMVNQLLCGVHVAATCEALAFAVRAGADPDTVYEVIRSGAAASAAWETRVPTVLERDFEPRGVVEIFTKDLDIVLRAARGLDFPLPLTAIALQQFRAAAALGYGRNDDASVVRVYETLTGIEVKRRREE